MNKFIAIAALASLTGACASSPEKIKPLPISQARYGGSDCANLSAQHEDAAFRASALEERIRGRNKSDKIMVGIGAVVAWPALFFIKGNGLKDDYSRAMGEREAIERTMRSKGCTF